MCTYRRVIFECNHVVSVRRVKRCTIGEDYQQGAVLHDCIIKNGHPLHSRKVSEDCDRCTRLKKAAECFWANIQECREEFGKVTILHPTDADWDVDINPTDSGKMERWETSDTKPSKHSEPNSMAELDLPSRETKNQDGWVYSTNGRLQSNGREVEEDTGTLILADNQNLDTLALKSKDNFPAEAVQALEPPRCCIPRQKPDSRLMAASSSAKKSAIPVGTGNQASVGPKPALKKYPEMGRAIPTTRAIPRLKSVTVEENPHSNRTLRQAVRTPHKPSDGKAMRIPQPTRR